MRAPPIHPREPRRLQALRDTGLLDSGMEERFDRITRVTRRLFDVPIALVSLVDENRQWFKSCDGLDARQTPRDVSFCGHAILERGVLCVEDATLDPRFDDNPLVLDEPKIRFYAGSPLRDSNDLPLGTLCIIDRRPRRFSDADRALLQDMAAIAEREVNALYKAVATGAQE